MSVTTKKDIVINKYEAASFDVDAQKTFTPICPNELPVEGGDTIASTLNRMAEMTRLRVGSKDAHCREAVWVNNDPQAVGAPMSGFDHADRQWPEHAIVGTAGFQLLDELPHPSDYDFFVYKGAEPDMHPYGACFHDLAEKQSTGVIEYLKSQGVQHVLVGGLAYDICVANTVRQLADNGFFVLVVDEATYGVVPEGCDQTDEMIRKHKKIHKVSINQIR